jgi:hypothetical protein
MSSSFAAACGVFLVLFYYCCVWVIYVLDLDYLIHELALVVFLIIRHPGLFGC